MRHGLIYHLLVFSLVLMSCAVKETEPTIEQKLSELEVDFEKGYTSSVESKARELAYKLPKGTTLRLRAFELYAKALEENSKNDEAARTFAQLAEENPFEKTRRTWLRKSAENYLLSRSRDEADPTPLFQALEQINNIEKIFGTLEDGEKKLKHQIKEKLIRYYQKIVEFYQKRGKNVSADIYREKIAELDKE
ncbi:MAG: hypothetical protein NZT61_04495 [Deltaproteobacteria bacterium]|nr:hypothetical protein [Deltaproteobacteria bacterium]MCX7952150.1 hypothetical protein [Deltaproteobacteria bacterium]